ncbi:hypothetical protein NUSPORA_03006 [Nucleospora cyclopteri]
MLFYTELIKEFIKKFNLEPAGARGCWSINDFSLLGHLFGSSILVLEESINHAGSSLVPVGLNSCHGTVGSSESMCSGGMEAETMNKIDLSSLHLLIGRYKTLWLNAVSDPNPMLLKIMNLRPREINSGIIKMYDREVLQKRVVTQHFIYSKELPI